MRNGKLLTFLIIIAILFTGGLYFIPSSFKPLVDTSLYFHSALLQANAAILSIIGVFFIFYLQNIKTKLSDIDSYLESLRSESNEVNEFLLMSEDTRLKHVNEVIKNKENKNDTDPMLIEWAEFKEKVNGFKQYIKAPTILLAFSIGFHASFLALSEIIICDFSIGFLFIPSLICFQIYILTIVVRTIIDIMTK
ncbi:hypothetical protein ACFLS9_07740 [Bacteroidota bacterium]